MAEIKVPKDVIFLHGAFVHYITPDEATAHPQDQSRTSASLKKLASFSETHLIELSSDMYDELQRRRSPSRAETAHLEARKDIHWKRNDARKHVGSLPDNRFREICRDLVTEHERRYSELNTGPTYPLQDSMPMSDLKARRSQKSLSQRSASQKSLSQRSTSQRSISQQSDRESTYTIPSHSSSNDSKKPAPVHIPTDQVLIQSVNESNITPTKVQIIESDDESNDESDDGTGSTDYEDSGNDVTTFLNRSELDNDRTRENVDLSRDLDETRTSASSNLRSSQASHREFDTEKLRMSNDNSMSKEANPLDHDDNAVNPMGLTNVLTQTSPDLQHDSDDGMSPHTPFKGVVDDNALESYPISPPHSSNMADSKARTVDSNLSEHPSERGKVAGGQHTQDEYDALKTNLDNQRRVTEQVRQEAVRFLEEMRSLTEQHERQISRADSLDAELKYWQGRLAKTNKELESVRQSRLDVAISQPELCEPLPESFKSATGKVSESHLRTFMNSISVLVAAIHNSERSQNLLELLHRVVLSTRDISSEDKLMIRAVKQLISVVRNYTVSSGLFPKMLVGSACSDLTTAVIEFVTVAKVVPEEPQEQESATKSPKLTSKSPKPVKSVMFDTAPETDESDQDDSTHDSKELKVDQKPDTHSEAIREVGEQDETETTPEVKVEQKIESPSESDPVHEASVPQSDAAIEPETAPKSTPKAEVTPEPTSEVTPLATPESSVESKPKSENSFEAARHQFRPKQGPELPLDESIQSLQTYLEEQTSGTVEAISALLSGIKSNAVAGELKPLMGQIKELVGDMIEATNKTMGETRSIVLKNKGSFIVQNLRDCLDRMDMLRNDELDAIRDDSRPNRHLKQRLAGVNFDMAKSTKELVKTVEEVVLQDELDHLDRRLG